MSDPAPVPPPDPLADWHGGEFAREQAVAVVAALRADPGALADLGGDEHYMCRVGMESLRARAEKAEAEVERMRRMHTHGPYCGCTGS